MPVLLKAPRSTLVSSYIFCLGLYQLFITTTMECSTALFNKFAAASRSQRAALCWPPAAPPPVRSFPSAGLPSPPVNNAQR
jgi:hypothetical protein